MTQLYLEATNISLFFQESFGFPWPVFVTNLLTIDLEKHQTAHGNLRPTKVVTKWRFISLSHSGKICHETGLRVAQKTYQQLSFLTFDMSDTRVRATIMSSVSLTILSVSSNVARYEALLSSCAKWFPPTWTAWTTGKNWICVWVGKEREKKGDYKTNSRLLRAERASKNGMPTT